MLYACCWWFPGLFTGFLSPEDCSGGNEPTVVVHKLFRAACAPLTASRPDKHILLADYHRLFLIGTMASYVCQAGYVPSQVRRRGV